MNDRSAYPVHSDLLAQVADSEAEDREVRLELSKPVTDAEIARINAARLGDVESAIVAQRQQRWKDAPWPVAPANHAHKRSRGCSGPCEGGAKACPTPQECQISAEPDAPRRKPSAWAKFGAAVICAASVAAVAFALAATGVSL